MVFCRSSAQAELPDDSLVHLHRPGDRPRGSLCEGMPGAGLPPHDLHRADERRGSGGPRRRGGRCRQDPRPRGTDTILGATIVARHAGEMINEISLAMLAGIGLTTVSQVIHSYPTQAEAIRKAGDAYNRTRLSPFLKALNRRWLAWSR